jgi:hypothetical protein
MRPFEEMFEYRGNPSRANFLARLFGLFNEQAVVHWCGCEQAAFTYLGRPTLKTAAEKRGHTLDFALKERHGGQRTFVAEMKCWLAVDQGRHLRLRDMGFCDKFAKESEAFKVFLNFAQDPRSYHVTIKSRPVKAEGAILIWSAVSPAGRKESRKCGFDQVLSIEEILRNLHEWNCAAWKEDIAQLRDWSADLFRYLGNE